jgi:hypothetical protein
MSEVFVGGQKCQIVPDCQLCKQRINRADLHACLTTGIPQGCRADVVISIGLKQGQGSEALDDLSPSPGA